MGLFNKWRKEKEYTLGEAMKIIAKPGNESLIPVAIHQGNPNTKYLIREEKNTEKLKAEQERSVITQKRDTFLNEVSGNGEFRSQATRPGRVIPMQYNNYQSAKNYQRKYGQGR